MLKSSATQATYECDFCASQQQTSGANPFKKLVFYADPSLSNQRGEHVFDVCNACLSGCNLAPLAALAS